MAEAPPAPSARASFVDLPPDCLRRIAELGLTRLSPLWDRGDLLGAACSLASVGEAGCTDLARLLFSELSPHLGE